MSTEPPGEPSHPGTGLVEQLRRGDGHERLYNAYASQLYRYCWTLVGDDADEALYESVLSAVHLLDELGEHTDFRPWLFSLARSACQRRGFVAESPYAQLSDEPAERPMVEIALRLPPSHSELLELYLRHGLTSSQIARIHGLDPDITNELCHAAVRRAADIRAECSPKSGGEVEHRNHPDHTIVSEVMALIEPPAPPEELRDHTVRGCADSTERAKAGAAIAPLGTDGFPLQRDRSRLTHGPRVSDTRDTGSDTETITENGTAANATTTAASSQNTSADIAAAEIAPGEPERAGHPPKGGRRRRRRRGRRYSWPLSATSGFLTVGVALTLWGMALLTAGDTNEPSHPDPPESTNPPPAAEGTSEQHPTTNSTPGGGTDPNTSGWDNDTGNTPDPSERNEGSSAENNGSANSDSDTPNASPDDSPDAGENGSDDESSTPSPEEEPGEDSAEAPESDDDSEPARGPISRFFNEIFASDE